MKYVPKKQRGFAMAAMLVGSAIVFTSGVVANTPDGTSFKTALGFAPAEQSEFAAMEISKGHGSEVMDNLVTSDEYE